MKIIIAGKYAPDGATPIGGSQSWIATVAAELKRRGHIVTLWEPGRPLNGRYDLGIIQHVKHTAAVAGLCDKSVQICHGIIDEEKPGDCCDIVAYVSEGVRDHWQGAGPIIRQPIDLDFWKPQGVERNGGAVRFSYRTNTLPHAKETANELGMAYKQIRSATPEQARDELSRAQLVFATGRAALEAMACGAPVCIYDHRSAYQGPLLGPPELYMNAQQSYSGRGGYEPNGCALMVRVQEILQRKQSPRDWVIAHHDARKITKDLLCLAS